MKFIITLQQRLAMTIAVLCAMLLAVVGMGMYGMRASNQALERTVSVELRALKDLNDAEKNLARSRLVLDRLTMHADVPEAAAQMDRALSFLDASQKAWEDYQGLPVDEATKTLRLSEEDKRQAFMKEGLMPLIAALRAGDHTDADDLTMHKMAGLFVDMSKDLTALEDRQQQEADQLHALAVEGYQRTTFWFVVLSIVAMGLSITSGLALRRAIVVPLEKAVRHAKSIATGDLTNDIDAGYQDEIGNLLTALGGMQTQLIDVLSQVQSSGVEIAHASAEIASGNLNLSARTEEQAASLEETAASMEELTATVRHNTDNAQQASSLATSAAQVADQGREVVNSMVGTMHAITTSSSKISEITALIEGIAFQTNILALNAAVEAARAGEQGRGFAVVAAEVRSLAQRSSTAAKEIKGLIEESSSTIRAGADQAEKVGGITSEVLTAVKRVSDIVSEISAASREQTQGIEQVNQAVSQMDSVTQQNAALVEEAAAAASSMSEQAQNLKQAVEIFRLPSTR